MFACAGSIWLGWSDQKRQAALPGPLVYLPSQDRYPCPVQAPFSSALVSVDLRRYSASSPIFSFRHRAHGQLQCPSTCVALRRSAKRCRVAQVWCSTALQDLFFQQAAWNIFNSSATHTAFSMPGNGWSVIPGRLAATSARAVPLGGLPRQRTQAARLQGFRFKGTLNPKP